MRTSEYHATKSFINSYKPQPPPILSTAPQNEPYDINFAFPLPLSSLQTNKIRLTPFIPSIHAEPFYASAMKNPDIDVFRWIPFTFPKIETFLVVVEEFRKKDDMLMFAVIDKVKLETGLDESECVAGILGLVGMSYLTRSVEMGPVIILPEYQRTHVSTHAIGIALRYILDLPSTPENPDSYGLGFRRVQWTANPDNAASIRSAERMGLRMESRMRWTWCIGEEKEGKEAPKERGGGKGRDSVMLAVCWDDWENGVRDHVTKLMERVQ